MASATSPTRMRAPEQAALCKYNSSSYKQLVLPTELRISIHPRISSIIVSIVRAPKKFRLSATGHPVCKLPTCLDGQSIRCTSPARIHTDSPVPDAYNPHITVCVQHSAKESCRSDGSSRLEIIIHIQLLVRDQGLRWPVVDLRLGLELINLVELHIVH